MIDDYQEILPSWDEIVAESWRIGDLSFQLKKTQLEIINWWNNDVDAILTIVHARRGFGKTWLLLTDAFSTMAKNPGCRLVYAAPSREMAKSIVVPTAHLLIPKNLPNEVRPVWAASEHAFIHPNGGRCVIEGADDDRGDHLRGPFAHKVYMDEVAFWRHCDYVYRSVLYPQVERTGGRMIGVSTSPESTQHEFATILIPEAKAEDAYVRVSLDDDYTVTDEHKMKIASQFSPTRDAEDGRKSTQFRREYGCELVTESERAVLPEFNIELHVKQSKRPEFYDGYTVLDLGMTDLTHCLFAYYDFERATIVVENEVVRQYVTVSQLAPEIYETEKRLWGKQPRIRIADAQPISLAEFSRQHALQPDLVPKEMRFAAAANRDPEALINRCRSLLAAGRIEVRPECKELISQCLGGLWNERRTDFERIPRLGHLDGVMALVYLVDCVNYQDNPEAAQRKYKADDYPVEFFVRNKSSSVDSLINLLPRSARKPMRPMVTKWR